MQEDEGRKYRNLNINKECWDNTVLAPLDYSTYFNCMATHHMLTSQPSGCLTKVAAWS